MIAQRNKLLKAFLAVLVVAAVAAPAGLASDFRSPDTQDAAKAARDASPTDMSSPDTQDAAKGRRVGGPTTEVVTVAAPGRFDWIDAGIGVASGLGASLIGAGGLLVVLKRRRGSVAVA
jgi:hypothetical protein